MKYIGLTSTTLSRRLTCHLSSGWPKQHTEIVHHDSMSVLLFYYYYLKRFPVQSWEKVIYILSVRRPQLHKEKEKEKMFIQIKNNWYYNVYIYKLKLSINFSDYSNLHIDRKKRKGKIVEDNNRDRAAYANKKALALLLKPASPTPSNTGSARSFQRDTVRGTKVLRYCKILQRGGA